MLGVDVAVKTFRDACTTAPVVPPISVFIVKLAELCNINCRYCYMYNLKDVSYLNRPKVMAARTRDALIARIREHAQEHKLARITLMLHGGEPLLAGKAYIEGWAAAARSGLAGDTEVLLAMQTNGILIDDEWCEIFGRHDIRLGVSIDGPRAYNDKYRVDHRGAGTFDLAVAGYRRLMRIEAGRGHKPALLSVANPEIPPREMWNLWRSLEARFVDFLLPHYTHDDPPPFDLRLLSDWMIALFDLWWEHDDPEIEVRYFRNIINLILGSTFSMDYLGGKPTGIVVIESDGAVTGYDTLRACEEGLIELGFNVRENSLESARTHPIFRLCNHPGAFLSPTCARCRVRDVCGGGFITHRYSRERGFNNPSVYCDSLLAIISHIERRVAAELRQAEMAADCIALSRR